MPPSAPLMMAEMPTQLRRGSPLLEQFHDLFQDFLTKGGPVPAEYPVLNLAIHHLGDAVRSGMISRNELKAYVQHVSKEYLAGTMQAEAVEKQFGYSGDFQIIDHIYTRHCTKRPEARLWDLYFHAQAAPVAVRNRKAYFHDLLTEHLAQKSGGQPLQVLNVASGPARDLREFFLNAPEADLVVDCVEMDDRAIRHAMGLCAPWMDRLVFHQRNVLRFVPVKGYDLVWSAGLFDYLNDKVFAHLLRALLAVVKPGGELVVGNFSEQNPSQDYMELLGHWDLQHRTQQQLLNLASQAGAPIAKCQVNWEAQGVNYFLHIRK